MSDSDDVRIMPLPAVPVRYAFLSVHRIVGFSSLPEGRPLAIDLGIDGVTASLVGDPNPALIQIDRWSALAVLMMSAFGGRTEGADILAIAEKKAHERARERAKDQTAPGVYILLRVEGWAETEPTTASRDLGAAVFASDAIDKDAIKARHAGLASVVLTAISLTVDRTSPDLVSIAEGVELTLSDGRPLYSITFTAGAPKVSTARTPSGRDSRRIAELAQRLLATDDLATPARLLVDALRNNDARLEGFILAWAALEMIVRKQTRNFESGEWLESAPRPKSEAATAVHRAFLASGHGSYSLSVRVRAFGLLHGFDDWEQVAEQVNTLRKQYREPLYHEGRFKESDLPLEQVIGIARRLMVAVLAEANPDHGDSE